MLLKVSNFEASQEVPQPGRQDDKLRQVRYLHVVLAELKSFQLFCDEVDNGSRSPQLPVSDHGLCGGEV